MKPTRLAAAAVGIYLALMVLQHLLIVAFTGSARQRRYNQDAFGYARMSAKTVAEAYENYYASGYYKFRELVGDIMILNPDLRDLWLLDVEGRVLFHSAEFAQGKPSAMGIIDNPELLAAVKGLELSCRMDKDDEGRGVLDIVVPHLEEWGRHRVSVRYRIVYHPWGEQWREIWGRILLAGLVSLALGAAIILLACRRLARGGPWIS